MDAILEAIRELRRSLSQQDELIRSTRERLNSEISLVRGKIYELNARMDNLLRTFGSDYTEAVITRFGDMEDASEQNLMKINDVSETLDSKLAEQASRVNALFDDISILQEETRAVKSRLSDLSSRTTNVEILERLSRLEKGADEKEMNVAVDKMRG